MTDLLTRFVEVAPKEFLARPLRRGLQIEDVERNRPVVIVLDDDKASAGALILLLDKLEEAGPPFAYARLCLRRTFEGYDVYWDNGEVREPLAHGATRIEAVVKAFVEVMEK